MIVCADDYGLRDDIDRAILALVDGGRLSAVSCLVAFERWSASALTNLLAFGPRIDIGLHFCLTDENLSLSCAGASDFSQGRFSRYGPLLRRSLIGRADRRETAKELATQYGLFVERCDRSPDYIDGHVHVHQLPGIRDGVLDFLSSLPPGSRPYVRNTYLPLGELRRRGLPWLKPAAIGAFGRKMFHRLRSAGVPTNRGFSGIYDFGKSSCYPSYFPKFVDCLTEANGMLVVHPGHDEAWRHQEFRVINQSPLPPGRLNRFQRGPGA
jgi:hypothetical protein